MLPLKCIANQEVSENKRYLNARRENSSVTLVCDECYIMAYDWRGHVQPTHTSV